MARSCVAQWPARAERVSAKVLAWPLTLVLPKAANIPDEVTAAATPLRSAGLRILYAGAHPPMRISFGRASANRSNEVSPTNLAHVVGQPQWPHFHGDRRRAMPGRDRIDVLDVLHNRVLRPG